MSSPPAAAVDAISGLYAVAYRRLVGVVALAAASDGEAEDCVQEAFIKLLDAWPTVSAYDDPEAWVRKVAFRLLSNRRRKTLNGARAVARYRAGTPAAPVSEHRLDIAAAVARLPLPQRQVVVLHYLVGDSVSEIAETLRVAPGTVKSRLSRARSALAPLLTEESAHA